ALGGGRELEPGLLDLQIGRQTQFSLFLANGLEVSPCFSDFSSRQVSVPNIPLQQRSGGVTARSVVEFPSVIIIKAPKRTQVRQVTTLSAADLFLCCGLPLSTGGTFRASRDIARVRSSHGAR